MDKICIETDLAPHACSYLKTLGCDIRSEVHHVDIVGKSPDGFIGVELKTVFNIDVLYQAVRTQRWAGHSLIVVPLVAKTARLRREKIDKWTSLCKALKIGLCVVEGNTSVLRCCYPGERIGKGTLHKEFTRQFKERSQDFNVGGSTRVSLVTAARERSCHIVKAFIHHIHEKEENSLSPKEVTNLSQQHSVSGTLYSNDYNWFVRLGYGQYALSRRVMKDRELIDRVVGSLPWDEVTTFLA